jgi:lipid-A-disaccharide synthase
MRPKLPIIDYVSPSVWAWRPGRAPAMRRYIDEVMALFPFEPEVHRRLGGPPCAYVGHPLAEEVALLRPNAEEARRRDCAAPVLLLLPGSRRSEVQNLLPVFRAAADRVAAEFPAIDIIIPTVAWLRETVERAVGDWAMRPRVIVDQAEKNAAFRVARAALAASGTVTLELAIAGVPSVVAYKVSLTEEIVARALINASSMVLANLVLDANVMPEFVQRDVTAKTLGKALIALLRDTPARQRQLDAFAKLDTIMEIRGAAPSVRAAEIVLRTATSGAK